MLSASHPFEYPDLISITSHALRIRPFFIVSKISKEIRTIKECSAFTARERQALQKYVDDLSGCIGSSERIVQTPGVSYVHAILYCIVLNCIVLCCIVLYVILGSCVCLCLTYLLSRAQDRSLCRGFILISPTCRLLVQSRNIDSDLSS